MPPDLPGIISECTISVSSCSYSYNGSTDVDKYMLPAQIDLNLGTLLRSGILGLSPTELGIRTPSTDVLHWG